MRQTTVKSFLEIACPDRKLIFDVGETPLRNRDDFPSYEQYLI
jgi:hypothetical protein